MNKDVLDKILDNHKLWLKTDGEEGKRANIQEANLDYSSMPLSCKGLNVHIDDRLAIQQLYHLVRNVQFSKNTSAEMKKVLLTEDIVKKANEFHRVQECGEITVEGGGE